MLYQPRRNFDDFDFRNCQPRRHCKLRCQVFVSENTHMLRIVLELDDVGIPIGPEHQLALCAATHAPNMLHRQNRQARIPASF